MDKRITKCISVLVMVLMAMSSCRSITDFIYLQDVVAGDHYTYNRHEPVVHPGDKLNITVSCKNPELAIPFNSNGGVVQMSSSGSILDSEVKSTTMGYRVDINGNIEFPVLGLLHVAGLTSKEVQDLIKNLIIEGKYITNPLVTMEFLNFKYVTMGAIGNGTHTSESGRVTILEAIANAGGVASNGNTKCVKVFREEGGYEVMYEIDLTNSDLLNSPCYYLQQNDIVYVEPRHKPRDVAARSWQVTLTVVSALTTLCTLPFIVRNYKNW